MNAEGKFQNCKIDTNYTIENNIDSGIDVNILDIGKPIKLNKVEIDSCSK